MVAHGLDTPQGGVDFLPASEYLLALIRQDVPEIRDTRNGGQICR